MRVAKVHFRPFCLPSPACGASVRAFSWNRLTTAYEPDVTCLVCMWHLGRYVPLVKLREHQRESRAIWERVNTW